MSPSTPESLQKLRTALHAKAKESPNYRFYALYDKVYRRDVLLHAYACCKANKGAAGVDGQGFEDIEKYGLERWLGELTGKAYRAVDQHVRKRLRQWLCTKHKVSWPGTKRFPEASLYDKLGLICLPGQTVNLPWAKA